MCIYPSLEDILAMGQIHVDLLEAGHLSLQCKLVLDSSLCGVV